MREQCSHCLHICYTAAILSASWCWHLLLAPRDRIFDRCRRLKRLVVIHLLLSLVFVASLVSLSPFSRYLSVGHVSALLAACVWHQSSLQQLDDSPRQEAPP